MEIIKASYYISASHHKTIKTPERITDCYEFELCAKGEGYTVINGVKYLRKNGILILAKPGQKRYSIGPFECYYIHFNLDPTDPLKANVDLLPDAYEPKDTARIAGIYHNVCDRTFGNTENEDLFIKGSVMQITAELNEMIYPFGIKPSAKYERYIDIVTIAKQYIDLNYATKLSLKTIAERVNLSPNFFRIVFKGIVGMSPHEYLIFVRTKKAQEYLSDTDFSISEIAEVCGFETQSYMNNIFCSKIKTTPYKYRKAHRREI